MFLVDLSSKENDMTDFVNHPKHGNESVGGDYFSFATPEGRAAVLKRIDVDVEKMLHDPRPHRQAEGRALKKFWPVFIEYLGEEFDLLTARGGKEHVSGGYLQSVIFGFTKALAFIVGTVAIGNAAPGKESDVATAASAIFVDELDHAVNSSLAAQKGLKNGYDA